MIELNRLNHTRPALLLAAAALAAPAGAADDVFEVAELETTGRVVTAHFADFDGDGRKDLVTATLDGILGLALGLVLIPIVTRFIVPVFSVFFPEKQTPH